MVKSNNTVPISDVSRIVSGTEFRGSITSGSDIRIDGSFEGHLKTAGKVVIGDAAHFVGDIVCDSVDIWGKVECKQLLCSSAGLKSKAVFEGVLLCERLAIEEGVVFNGSCKMLTGEEFKEMLSKIP